MIELINVSKSFMKDRHSFFTLKKFFLNFKEYIRNRNKKNRISPVKHLTVTVNSGEVLGILGRNGAGKSTLAKLIAGTMVPDSGTLKVVGKVIPFLELGVAFNNELTALDNLYLNGVVLGLSLSYLKNHKVEIFEFAELTGFENMPLKFYSSGMVLRLAFSIAMHAVGDIYIFDEIFAVGDEGFQKKCKDSFELLLDAKKTIVLISHDFSFLKKYVTQLLVLSPRDIFQISGRDRIAEYENAEDLLADFESGKLPAFNGPP